MSAEDVLARHQTVDDWPRDTCLCGTETPRPDEDMVKARHQLDALKAAGYAVVELPKPPPESQRWRDAEGNPDWDAHAEAAHHALLDLLADHYWITINAGRIHLPPNGHLLYDGDETGGTPKHARELAAALLAAADAAEAN